LKHYAYPSGRISAIFKNHLSSLQRVSTVPVFSYLWKREDQQPPTRDKRNAALRDGTTPITGTLGDISAPIKRRQFSKSVLFNIINEQFNLQINEQKVQFLFTFLLF